MEIWKDIKGYEGLYQVSNYGNFKSLQRKVAYNHSYTNDRMFRIKKEKIMKPGISRGYRCVNLSSNNKSKTHRCCRIVAETFIPNKENKPQINHINGIKTDDKVENLEWVTNSENMIHAVKTGLLKIKYGKDRDNSRKVKCLITGKVFDTIKDAAKELNVSPSHLSRVLRGVYSNKLNLKLID